MPTGIDTSQLAGFRRDLEAVAPEIDRAFNEELGNAGRTVRDTARADFVSTFRRRTGAGERSIRSSAVIAGRVSVFVDPRIAWYARLLHEGFTHRGGWKKKTGRVTQIRGEPFLVNAVEANEELIVARLSAALDRTIERRLG